ncbi:MAG TPA: hypothetical protein VFA11_10035 [Acidimicrobiales bacterium]|nr:hypothetical protein [Acidimicrobiales bacterium]
MEVEMPLCSEKCVATFVYVRSWNREPSDLEVQRARGWSDDDE